jgi:transposase
VAPRLPKEVPAAIELAINVAHSKGKRPNLENITAIFDTTYKSVRHIRRRINITAATGIDPRKKPGPKTFGGTNPDDIEQYIREVLERNAELDQRAISNILKEKFGVDIGRTTISRFIKARTYLSLAENEVLKGREVREWGDMGQGRKKDMRRGGSRPGTYLEGRELRIR